jgi:hypothetical protein
VNLFATIDEKAKAAGLDYLVIGGHAVNAHGYFRTTLDIDLLVAEEQLPAWKHLLTELGYAWGHESPAFVQFAEPPESEEFPIDLMVVNAATFSKLTANSVVKDFGEIPIKVPRILDLIALKLHALRSTDRAADGKDLQDVLALARLDALELSDPEFSAIIQKHASPETRDELRRILS